MVVNSGDAEIVSQLNDPFEVNITAHSQHLYCMWAFGPSPLQRWLPSVPFPLLSPFFFLPFLSPPSPVPQFAFQLFSPAGCPTGG